METMVSGLSPRLERIRAELFSALQRLNCHILHDEADARSYREIAERAYGWSMGRPEVLRKAGFLAEFAEEFSCVIREGELIVGSQRFGPCWKAFGDDAGAFMEAVGYHPNNGHIIVDYGRFVRDGIEGVRARLGEPGAGHNVEAFGTVLDAFSRMIRRYAEAAAESAHNSGIDPVRREELEAIARNCMHISGKAPADFHQALQMVWFVQMFLHAESATAAFSFGRFDQYMWPFLEKDLREGRITIEWAKELLACFWLKCCEGDESQNIVFGGVDDDGEPAENPLSLMCLEVAAELRIPQPSVSVRIGAHTSDEFWSAAIRLCQTGGGMPSFFNDDAIIPALTAAGIPIERARDYGIVGCYEATPHGDTYGMTVNYWWVLPNVLIEAMDRMGEPADFEAFVERAKACYQKAYAEAIKAMQETWDRAARVSVSPFESVCQVGCIESGLTVEEGGSRFNLFGVNMLGLGTVVDSLYVIKTLVYDEQAITLSDLHRQVFRRRSSAGRRV